MELNVGDKIITRHGPYEAVATVIEVNESGAVLTPATKPQPWQPPTGHQGTPPSPAYLAAKQALGRSHQ